MFPRLKAQAPEISDEQAITQAIKELCTSHLHNHLVREHPRTLEELYDEFHKFSRAEVLHFRKLGQQRKSISENESSRPFKYSKGKEAQQVLTRLTDKFTASTRTSVDHQKIGRKTLGLCGQKARVGHMIQEEIAPKLEAAMQIEVVAGVKCKAGPSTACFKKATPTIG
jgi:hypothetical protein